MAPSLSKRPTSAAVLLSLRSRGIKDAGAITRLNMKLLRGIIIQDSREFTKVWSRTSKSTIMYESGKLYFENYQICHSCAHPVPKLLYTLPRRSKLEKIEDALLCQSSLDKTLPSPSDHKPSLLALANNWLLRLSTETGKELQKFYLSSKTKFKYLNWDASQEIFYVKSILNRSALARQAGTVMTLTIFKVFPLEIVGSLEINIKVFGSDVADVILSLGILVVSHSNQSIKLYSFEHILKKHLTEKLTLGKPSSLLGGKTVGAMPVGIPVNIQITERPPILFELTRTDCGIQIGGFPWHYIYTPSNKKHKGTHHICSLKDKTVATNGIQNMNCCSLESDWVFFHPDNSGRIIHMGPSTINVLKILGELNTGLPSKVVTDFTLDTKQNSKPTSQVTVTSYGRTVRRRFHQLDDDPEQKTSGLAKTTNEQQPLCIY